MPRMLVQTGLSGEEIKRPSPREGACSISTPMARLKGEALYLPCCRDYFMMVSKYKISSAMYLASSRLWVVKMMV